MLTRIRSTTGFHLFDAPLIRIPPSIPGAGFLSALGSAYNDEEQHLRSRLLGMALDLQDTLNNPQMQPQRSVAVFLKRLQPLIAFLETTTDAAVSLYSYDRQPSVSDLIVAYQEGLGTRDWAIELMAAKGEKGRTELTKLLNNQTDPDRLLTALSILLIVFPDDQSRAAVQNFIDDRSDDIGANAAQLLATYGCA